jgi:hypothetical protein
MYKKLTKALLYTREDFTSVCKLLGVDAEKADPAMLDTVMCDECSFWELPSKAFVLEDDTVLCKACHELETLRF